MIRRFSTLLIALAVWASAGGTSWGDSGDKKPKVEYAVRWNIAEGGPQTTADVVKLLGQQAGDTDDFTVVYFDVKRTAAAPPGFSSILRQGTKKKEVALMFKYRGQHRLTSWECPLPNPTKKKEEIDESFVPSGVQRAYSYSCTIEADKPIVPPPALEASKPCASNMIRTDAGDLEIEFWELPKGMKVIEVSRTGDPAKKDREAFRRQVVRKLKNAGIKPLERGMADLAKTCP